MTDWLSILLHPSTVFAPAPQQAHKAAKASERPGPGSTPAPPPAARSSVDQIEICRRPAHIDLYTEWRVSGLAPTPDHWRLRTPAGYRGEGRLSPRASYADLPTVVVTDDADGMDEPGASCVPAGRVDPRWRHVDAACVERVLPRGRALGRWLPTVNDCRTTVVDALDACAEDPAAVRVAPHPVRQRLYDAAARLLDLLGR